MIRNLPSVTLSVLLPSPPCRHSPSLYHVVSLGRSSLCFKGSYSQPFARGTASGFRQSKRFGMEPTFVPLRVKRKPSFVRKQEKWRHMGNACCVEEQKLDWADMLHLTTLPPDDLNEYCTELRKLAMELIMLMGEALDVEGREMRELFEQGWQTVRMNYYPACPTQRRVPINPLPHAFVVNVGDTFEIVSNGIYKSIEHRATVNSKKERMSMATFFNARSHHGVMMGPSPSLVTPERPPQFKTIPISDFWKTFFTRQLRGSNLDYLRIPNATHEST
ncbi:hypothetical protein K1719_032970 [Acacia pycnantha]|nr:hypothetical protein K1719_032970 [Acacia pycnantha]